MCSNNRHQCSKIAVVGALATFTFLMPAIADELNNLGPVPPHEPILTSVGTKRVIAFYLPGSGQCALHSGAGRRDDRVSDHRAENDAQERRNA